VTLGRAEVTTTGFLPLCCWTSRATARRRSCDPIEAASNFMTIMGAILPHRRAARIPDARIRMSSAIGGVRCCVLGWSRARHEEDRRGGGWTERLSPGAYLQVRGRGTAIARPGDG